MAELDYAFLADYAAIQDGRLTTVGASFTHMFVPQLPARAEFSVAARLRVLESEIPPDFEVRISAPRSNANMAVTGQIAPGPEALAYDGKKGILVTLKADLLVTYEELVTVDLNLNGDHVRRLAFDVKLAQPNGR